MWMDGSCGWMGRVTHSIEDCMFLMRAWRRELAMPSDSKPRSASDEHGHSTGTARAQHGQHGHSTGTARIANPMSMGHLAENTTLRAWGGIELSNTREGVNNRSCIVPGAWPGRGPRRPSPEVPIRPQQRPNQQSARIIEQRDVYHTLWTVVAGWRRGGAK